MVMDPRNIALECFLWLLHPPTTNNWLGANCTVVQAQHGSGRSPVVTLTENIDCLGDTGFIIPSSHVAKK